MKNTPAETIFALSSAPGKAGVAVIRLSGPQAIETLVALTGKALKPRHATLGKIVLDGVTLDTALLLTFPAPHSFTGNDCAEIHTHGSRAVVKTLLSHLATLPRLRLAEPGEFSRQAYLNGKMDLLEAEGIADLIDAETNAQRSQALRQMEGETGQRFEALRTRTVTVLSLLETLIDFSDEDIPEGIIDNAHKDIATLTHDIETLLADGNRGERIREGFKVAILGAPNAGKSSLINALARRDVAIVSDIPGTTRDALEATLDIGGYAVTFTDTAGLRKSNDAIEAEGITRALRHADQADIKLILVDGTAESDPALLALFDSRSILIRTKADISPSSAFKQKNISLSSKTGMGLDELTQAIIQKLDNTELTEAPIITRMRHRLALEEALNSLKHWSAALALELQCEELRRAATSIGKITGKIVVDELLDRIFREFCIGK